MTGNQTAREQGPGLNLSELGLTAIETTADAILLLDEQATILSANATSRLFRYAAVATNDVISDPHIHDKDWAALEGMVAFAAHPLIVDNHVIGVMALFSRPAFCPEGSEARVPKDW